MSNWEFFKSYPHRVAKAYMEGARILSVDYGPFTPLDPDKIRLQEVYIMLPKELDTQVIWAVKQPIEKDWVVCLDTVAGSPNVARDKAKKVFGDKANDWPLVRSYAEFMS